MACFDLFLLPQSGIQLRFSYWLCAADFSMNLLLEVAIVGNQDDHTSQELVDTSWSTYRPNLVAAIISLPPRLVLLPSWIIARRFKAERLLTFASPSSARVLR
jgi:hypothetical protein